MAESEGIARLQASVDYLIGKIALIERDIFMASSAMDRIKEAVAKVEDQGDATILLLKELAEEIRQNVTDQAALNEIADRLDAQAGEFVTAIEENTPPSEPTA